MTSTKITFDIFKNLRNVKATKKIKSKTTKKLYINQFDYIEIKTF